MATSLTDDLWMQICTFNCMLWEFKETLSGIAYVMRLFDIMARATRLRPTIGVSRWTSTVPRSNIKLKLDRYRKIDARGFACPYGWNAKAEPDLKTVFDQEIAPWVHRQSGDKPRTSQQPPRTDRTIVSIVREVWKIPGMLVTKRAMINLKVGNCYLYAQLDTGSPTSIMSHQEYCEIRQANLELEFTARPTRNGDLSALLEIRSKQRQMWISRSSLLISWTNNRSTLILLLGRISHQFVY